MYVYIYFLDLVRIFYFETSSFTQVEFIFPTIQTIIIYLVEDAFFFLTLMFYPSNME